MGCDNCLKNQCKPQQNMTITPYPALEKTKQGLMKITRIFLIITRDCNLRCKYCYVKKEPANMPLDIAIDAVEFIARNALISGENPSINFFGGEPLLRWSDLIIPLALYIRKKFGNKFKISMTSNGLLLDREKLEFMKSYNIGLMFSMDGNKQTQDLNRPTKYGNSSFEILKEKIPLILEYYPNITFRSTTDHDNVSQFFDNHRFAVENGFKKVFNTVNVFVKWSETEKIELKKQIKKLGNYYLRLLLEGRSISFNPLKEMLIKLKYIDEAKQNKYYRDMGKNELGYGRCGLGADNHASVGIDGTLYSCQEIVAEKNQSIFRIGDIYNGENNEARLKLINKFDPKKVICSEGNNSCLRCKLNDVCDGGCLINNYFVTGDINIMPSILCFYNQALLEEAEKIRNTLMKYNLIEKIGM